MKSLELSDDQAKTLIKILDFAASKLTDRMNGKTIDQWDSFSVWLAHEKVTDLSIYAKEHLS